MKCDEAIQHFYEVVAPDQRLKELSRLMGVNFVPWGTIHDGVVHGGRYQGEWVNLGIRWHRDRTTWDRETSTNVKNVATANGNKAKPHISVMFEDAELFDFFEKTRILTRKIHKTNTSTGVDQVEDKRQMENLTIHSIKRC